MSRAEMFTADDFEAAGLSPEAARREELTTRETGGLTGRKFWEVVNYVKVNERLEAAGKRAYFKPNGVRAMEVGGPQNLPRPKDPRGVEGSEGNSDLIRVLSDFFGIE